MTPSQLVERVAAAYGLDAADVRSSSTQPAALRARRIVAYVLRVDRGCTFGEIARALGTTDRARVLRLVAAMRIRPDDDLPQFMGLA